MTAPLDCIQLPAGTRLFAEGEAGDHAYLIRSGEIEITIEREGQETVLARRGAGEIIGEMALIDRGVRSASAKVVTAVEVIAISLRQLEQRIENTDPILRLCLGVVIARYRETLLVAHAGHRARPTAPAPEVGSDFSAAVEILTLERELGRALTRGEFELFLQPIVGLGDRALAGFEALIRWRHPERGLLSPTEFIPVAEASGLVVDITAFMLREAARTIPLLLSADTRDRRAGREPLFVSVNVSGHDLLQPAFAETVVTILQAAHVSPANLKLEITESMLMKDPARAGQILGLCRAEGIGIAVDDFGTGYSSLSYLTTLPITTLKIDRCFVQAMMGDLASRKIVNTIRLLARELDIPVVAEGVETEAEAVALAAIHCEFGQGYLFGRPMPVTEALDVVRRASIRGGSPGRLRPTPGTKVASAS